MAKAIKTAVISALIVATGGALAATYGAGFAGFGAAFTAALTGTAALTAFFSTLVASGIGMLTSKGINATSENFGTKFSNRSASAPRQIIYGKTRVGGTVVHIETSGTDNYLLHMIIAVAGHEVEDIETVRFNDINLTTTTSTISGSTVYTVTNADFTNTDNDNNFGSGRLARFTKKLGTDAQTADGFANAQLTSISSTDRFRGVAYVYLQMVFDAEKFGSGIPAISFVVKGKKVYDPRTSTTAWSDNPALCIRDYITDTKYGLNATTDEINDSTNAGGFASAANICDQNAVLADGVSTETRYTANGFTNMSASGEGILEGLLSSCAGKMSYTNGKFNLFAGAAQTPTLTITDDDLLSPVSIATKPQSGDLYNTVKSIYVDSSNDYQGTEAPVYQDSTFLTEDTPSGSSSANFVKELEMQLPFTTSVTMAQRLQRIGLNANRQTTSISLLTTTKFMRLQPNDWVYVTNERLGYSSKVFEVVSMNLEVIGDDVPVLATKLVLQEIETAVFSFVAGDYQTAISEGTTLNTGSFTISPPSGLTTTVSTNNNFNVNNVNITVSWTNAPAQVIMGTEIQYKKSTDSTYEDHTFAPRGVTSTVIRALEVGVTYNIRIRHVAVWNVFSSYVSTTQATGGTALTSTDVDNSNVGLTVTGTTISVDTSGTGVTLDKTNVGLNDLSDLDSTQNTKLTGIETGATVGARLGTNLKDVDGVTDLGVVDVKNNQLSLGVSGTTLVLNNGGGNTTLSKTNVGLNDLGDLDSTQNAKLNGVETGATVGAKAGLNLKKSDDTTLGDSDIITSQGTAASIASQGALATANTADFATQVAGSAKPANNATNNGSTINTSGNVTGSMTVASGGSITIGNITINGTDGRILITD